MRVGCVLCFSVVSLSSGPPQRETTFYYLGLRITPMEMARAAVKSIICYLYRLGQPTKTIEV